MSRIFDVSTSLVTTLARFMAGNYVGQIGKRPEKPLELYEFEACPFCRKVREALAMLDLDVRIFPCPKGGKRYRAALKKRAGKEQFPYLVDPNTDTEMFESDAIVKYLFEQYGEGKVPVVLGLGPLTDLGSVLSGIPRLGAGGRAEASRAPDLPLELYSMEASPFCRLVREKLCELEIPYTLRNVAKGSPRREAFAKRSGKLMVPWLSDPNTGSEMFESADIIQYLQKTYASS